MTFRPMPVLTGLSVISLAILLLLGSWQYQRYSEKMAAPVQEQVDAAVTRLTLEIDHDHPGNVQQVYGFADSEPLWRRYAPGNVAESGEPVLIMIEATGGAQPLATPLSNLPATIAYDGILARKQASGSAFNAQDNPDADQWYSLSPDRIWAHLGLEGAPLVAEPVIMTVRNAADLSQSRLTPNPYAYAKPLDPLPPERHFGYALTWWGMALGLIGVYVALHRARGRLKF
nr:SURF1 family cytochrome oxidase biogenesis protein [Hyphomonas sp. Mor2]